MSAAELGCLAPNVCPRAVPVATSTSEVMVVPATPFRMSAASASAPIADGYSGGPGGFRPARCWRHRENSPQAPLSSARTALIARVLSASAVYYFSAQVFRSETPETSIVLSRL